MKKRLVSLVIVLVMLFSWTFSAQADNSGTKITFYESEFGNDYEGLKAPSALAVKYRDVFGKYEADKYICIIYTDRLIEIDETHLLEGACVKTESGENYYYFLVYDAIEEAKNAVNNYKSVEGVVHVEQPRYFNATNDVNSNDWFGPAVMSLRNKNIMVGYDDGFRPYEKICRAQFVSVLYQMDGGKTIETEKTFTDIFGGEWFENAVLWAAESDIVYGYKNGSFGPCDEITREQIMVILYRYAKAHGINVESQAELIYQDKENISDFAREAVNWAVAVHIVSGKDLDGDGEPETIDPLGSATRAEAAVIINNLIEKYVGQ